MQGFGGGVSLFLGIFGTACPVPMELFLAPPPPSREDSIVVQALRRQGLLQVLDDPPWVLLGLMVQIAQGRAGQEAVNI